MILYHKQTNIDFSEEGYAYRNSQDNKTMTNKPRNKCRQICCYILKQWKSYD